MTRRLLIGASILLAGIAGFLPLRAAQQQTLPVPFRQIAYDLSMPRPANHLFEVVMHLEVPPGNVPASVDLQMPLWQPGRYSVADFAENVQDFSVSTDGHTVPFHKADSQTWEFETRGNRSFGVRYKIFSNDLSGTYAQLDATHGNFTGGELFMYIVGHKQDPVFLEIHPPPGWHVINGRTDVADQTSWAYPDYELLIDNPTEIGGDWTLDEFTVEGKKYRVVVHSRTGENGLRPNLIRDLQKIVTAEVAMWGPPEFDRYTFMIHFAGDNHSYDGMEHLVSTQIVRPGSLSDPDEYQGTLETAAHEFFHAWNVKRLRPVELGPWDWTHPANTRSLWIAEGLTQYYGVMTMRRSGLWDDARLLRDLERTIGAVENAPGVKLMSAVDSSLFAPFLDAAVYRQENNFPNTTVSYYTKGELIGMVMDLLIRGRTGGRRSLDDVMKQMYDEFYVKSPNATYYLKGRGYTQEDFVGVLSDVVGVNMTDFYNRYIAGVQTLPYDDAFAFAGLHLVRMPADTGSGISIEPSSPTPVVSRIRAASAAEDAGLQQGDVLLSIGGNRATRENWSSLLARYRMGEKVAIELQRFRKPVEVMMEIRESGTFNYRLQELSNASAVERNIRDGWMRGAQQLGQSARAGATPQRKEGAIGGQRTGFRPTW